MLQEVDTFAKDLHESLGKRNLTDIVDIVFVSDHGMTDMSHPEMIYIDDILGMDAFQTIEHVDGWPCMGFRFDPSANITHNVELLHKGAVEGGNKFAVYTHETMPEEYHFANNERIAPVYVVPKIGYVVTDHANGNDMTKGVSDRRLFHGILVLNVSAEPWVR